MIPEEMGFWVAGAELVGCELSLLPSPLGITRASGIHFTSSLGPTLPASSGKGVLFEDEQNDEDREVCIGRPGVGLHSTCGRVNRPGEVTSGTAVHRWSLLCTCGFACWQFQRHHFVTPVEGGRAQVRQADLDLIPP